MRMFTLSLWVAGCRSGVYYFCRTGHRLHGDCGAGVARTVTRKRKQVPYVCDAHHAPERLRERATHPELAYSLKLFLPKASYDLRRYTESLNPPILHRKETFLDSLHPRYAEYTELTKQEEGHDLLSRSDIGTRNGWLSLLASRNLRIENNSVVPRSISFRTGQLFPPGSPTR